MEFYDLNEIKKTITPDKYKVVRLESNSGEQIVSRNSHKTSLKEQLEKIFFRLDSKGLPDGVYLIRANTSFYPKQVPDDYPILKGEKKPGNEGDPPQEPKEPAKNSPDENVRSYSEAITDKVGYEKAQIEIAALKKENEELRKNILELEDYIDELETEEEEPGLSESGVSKIVESLSATILPIADNYFKHRAEQMKLDAAKIALDAQRHGLNVPGVSTQRQPPQQQRQQLQITEDNVMQYLADAGTDENEYNRRLAYIAQVNPTLYAQVIDVLNNPENYQEEETE